MKRSYHILVIFSILFVVLTIGAMLIWLERRLLALWQDRYGPNRVGPFGLLQVLADMVKILTKEDWVPPFADKPVFIIAPAVIMVVVLMSFTVIPFAPGIEVVDLNIGAAVLPRHVVPRRVQRCTGRLGIGQQILAPGRPAVGRRRC